MGFVCAKVEQKIDIIRQIYKKMDDLADYNQDSPINPAIRSMRTPICSHQNPDLPRCSRRYRGRPDR